MAPPKFRYEPLDLSTQQIRLCKVEQRSLEEVLCTLQHFDFDSSCPKYTALSYTWGDELPLHTIMLNSCAFTIRQNLWNYLSHGVLPDTGYIWIDQICIDQRNTEERSAQVTIMADIYSQAEQVFVWLGEEAPNTATTLEYLHHCGLLEDSPAPEKGRPTPSLDVIDGLVNLFARPYWRRLWIIQELFRARVVTFCCGHASADAVPPNPPMFWFPEVFGYKYTGSQTSIEAAREGCWMFERCRTTELSKKYGPGVLTINSLKEVLDLFSQSECSDPRDKVFGLQSLVPRSERVRIDYSETVDSVYLKAIQMMSATEGLCRGRPHPVTCHIIRILRDRMNLGPEILDHIEKELDLPTLQPADPEGFYQSNPRPVTWSGTRGEELLDMRWDRAVRKLPWGVKNVLEVGSFDEQTD